MSGAIVVTGGGSGIGQATVLRMLRAGYPVVIAEVNEVSAAATVRLAEAEGFADRVATVVADVRREPDVAAAVDLAGSRFGGLRSMINNAGFGGAFGPVTDIESDDWDTTFAVNARGVFYGIKHAVRAFRAQGGGGSIVNVGSAAGFTGGFGPAVYSASKAAVINLTKAVSTELAADRIRVNVVCPGAIHTPLVHLDRPGSEELFDRAQPWPSHGTADQVAAAIVFLASDDAAFITGQSLIIDGGLSAAGPGNLLADLLGTDPGTRGISGISYGTTGAPAEVRRRPSAGSSGVSRSSGSSGEGSP